MIIKLSKKEKIEQGFLNFNVYEKLAENLMFNFYASPISSTDGIKFDHENINNNRFKGYDVIYDGHFRDARNKFLLPVLENKSKEILKIYTQVYLHGQIFSSIIFNSDDGYVELDLEMNIKNEDSKKFIERFKKLISTSSGFKYDSPTTVRLDYGIDRNKFSTDYVGVLGR